MLTRQRKSARALTVETHAAIAAAIPLQASQRAERLALAGAQWTPGRVPRRGGREASRGSMAHGFALLDKSAFSKRDGCGASGDDEVIEHLDIDHRQGGPQLRGQHFICAARIGGAGWVQMA